MAADRPAGKAVPPEPAAPVPAGPTPSGHQPVPFPQPCRGLPDGLHPFLALLPEVLSSPALRLVGTDRIPGHEVIRSARVRIVAERGFCWVDETTPCIVLTRPYYESGDALDLYLDLLHEATHLRQLLEGRDVWDESFPYHRRPTEIEGYAVAVAEGRRLGLDAKAIRAHVTNPWMTPAQVTELLAAIDDFLDGLRR